MDVGDVPRGLLRSEPVGPAVGRRHSSRKRKRHWGPPLPLLVSSNWARREEYLVVARQVPVGPDGEDAAVVEGVCPEGK